MSHFQIVSVPFSTTSEIDKKLEILQENLPRNASKSISEVLKKIFTDFGQIFVKILEKNNVLPFCG